MKLPVRLISPVMVAMVVAGAMLLPMMSACGNAPVDGSGQQASEDADSDNIPGATPSDSNLTTPGGVTTVDAGDGDGEEEDIPKTHVNLTVDMVPSVSSVPENRSPDEIRNAVVGIVTNQIPQIPVLSVELLGTQMTKQADGISDEMWASYVARTEGEDLGIEVVCSTAVSAVARVKDMLRVSDTQMYDVRERRYVVNDDTSGEDTTGDTEETPQPRPALRNEVNPDDPFTYYDDDGNLQPITERSGPHHERVEVDDGKGNKVWVRVDDLG